MNQTDALRLNPVKSFHGEVHLPGSKSLSNRILLLAAMSQGETLISNLLVSDDTRHMIAALKLLGVQVTYDEESNQTSVVGLGKGFPKKQREDGELELFLGNAGTAMRPLCAVLALCGAGELKLTGEPRMYERPIGPLVTALNDVGAKISYLGETGYPPLAISVPSLATGQEELNIELDGSLSSQYVTALLMALPMISNPCTLTLVGELVSLPYIEITLKVMERFGIRVERRGLNTFHFTGDEAYVSPKKILVEGDASSASYFLAAGAISGGPVKVFGISKSSVQGDVAFTEVVEKMGAEVRFGEDWVECRSDGALKSVDMDLNHIPDAAMTLATMALFAEGSTTIRNVYNWRLKETDRLAAMAKELEKVGARVEESEDQLVIHPPKELKSAEIETYDDHRMAMCFSLAAFGNAEITILDPGCTSKTFPEYFDVFKRLSEG